MKLLAFLILIFATSSTFASPCSEVLDQASVTQSEIQELILERAKIKKNIALSTLLEGDIKEKIAQYENVYKQPFQQSESKVLDDLAREENARQKIEQSVRKQQKAQTSIITPKMSVHTFTELNVINGVFAKDSVQWSRDERFVLIRPIESKHAKIIDLKTKQKLPITAESGILSTQGNYFAEHIRQERVTWVHDLETGVKYGPFEGYPRHNFNDQYIVLYRVSASSGNPITTITNFKNGTTQRIKNSLTAFFSKNLNFYVVANQINIEVFSSDTGKVLRKIRVDELYEDLNRISDDPSDAVVLYSNKKNRALKKILWLSNLTEQEIGRVTGNIKYHAGTGTVIKFVDKKYVVSRLGTSDEVVVSDYSDVVINHDGTWALFYNVLAANNKKKSSVLSLQNLSSASKPIETPANFTQFTVDGKALTNINLRLKSNALLFYLNNGELVEFTKKHHSLKLSNDSRFIIAADANLNTYFNIAETMSIEPEQNKVGYCANSSPSGKYLISYASEKRNKLIIHEVSQ